MTNDEQKIVPQDQSDQSQQNSKQTDSHPLATSLGAVGGGVAGASLGHSIIGGKVGSALGGIAGAIAGSIAGNKLAEFSSEAIAQIQPSGLGFGADNKPIELLDHYSWEELKALSKPQGGEIQHT